MNTTSSTPQTWRDLAPELTAEQVARLDHLERTGQPVGPDNADGLYRYAAGLARDNAVEARYAHLPAPPRAHTVTSWFEFESGDYRRSVQFATVGDDAVTVWADQRTNGQVVNPHLVVGTDTMTAAQARRLARHLITAADTADRVGQDMTD